MSYIEKYQGVHIVCADYHDIDASCTAQKLVVTFSDGGVTTYTAPEDFTSIQTRMKEQQEAILAGEWVE